MSFSATEAAFEGFRVVRRHPKVALFWGLAYLVMFVVMFGLGADRWATIMAAVSALEGDANPSAEDIAALGQVYVEAALWIVPVGLIVGAVLSAAVARSVLRPEESAWGYLRLGMDEVRVLVVTIIIGLVIGLTSGVCFAVAGTLGASGQPLLILLALLVGLGAIALIIWLSVKFSLAVPITVDRRRIAVVDSFKATTGVFWPLLGMAVIAAVMSIIISILGAIIGAAADMATGGLTQLGRFDGESTLQILTQIWPAILVWSVINAFLSALQLAVMYAPFAAAWQDLRGR